MYNAPYPNRPNPAPMMPNLPNQLQPVIAQLQALAALETPDNAVAAVAAVAARQWQTALAANRDFLENRQHSVVFIGKPGLGKSSLINVASNLLLGDERPTDKTGLKNLTVLTVGAGRTSVCEVQIAGAQEPGYRLEIEPLDLETMRQEIALFAQTQWQRHNSQRWAMDDDADLMAQESQRFIRNMTGLAEYSETYQENGVRKKRLIKPLDAEVAKFDSEPAFVEHLLACAKLSQRDQTSWAWPPEKASLPLLKAQFEAINQGSEARAMLPRKISVTLPEPFWPEQTSLTWHMVDTRGLDGSMTGRDDLYDWISDPRTVLVLCSEFKDAPEAVIRTLLRNMSDDAALQSGLERSILLLIDQGDAGLVNGADNDREFGQALKIEECHHILQGNNLALAKEQILTLDVLQDDCAPLLRAIDQTMMRQRAAREQALAGQLADARKFLENVNSADVARLCQQLDNELKAVMARHVPMGAPLADPLDGLYAAIRTAHQSRVYASCRRRGIYVNLQLYAAVKAEAARAATAWLAELINALQERLSELKLVPQYSPILDHINLRQAQINMGHLMVVQHYATTIRDEVNEYLHSDPIWPTCRAEWGQGSGFKDKVIGYMKDWSAREIRLTAHQQTQINSHIPLMNEVMRPAQAPRFSLYVRNLRTLREVNWAPEPLSIIIGANGTGKTTLLLILKLLQVAYERDLPEAVGQVLGGINNMRTWGIGDADPVELGIDIDQASWRLTLTPDGASVTPLARESLMVGAQEIFVRDELGQFRYHGQLVETSHLLGLRALMNRGAADPALRIMANFMQGIAIYFDPDLRALRTQGSNLTEDRTLHSRATNTIAILRRWHQDRQEKHRYQFVVEGLIAAFPNTVSDLDFDMAGNTVVARIYKPGLELPGPLRTEANGVIQMMVLLCAIASAEDESIVAIDEPENCLHPYAIMVFLRRTRLWARQHRLTILLTTHSTVLLDEMSAESGCVYVMKTADDSRALPTQLNHLRNPEWLAGFKLGDLYEQGEIGSNGDDD